MAEGPARIEAAAIDCGARVVVVDDSQLRHLLSSCVNREVDGVVILRGEEYDRARYILPVHQLPHSAQVHIHR
jgi:hypothetical protein